MQVCCVRAHARVRTHTHTHPGARPCSLKARCPHSLPEGRMQVSSLLHIILLLTWTQAASTPPAPHVGAPGQLIL